MTPAPTTPHLTHNPPPTPIPEPGPGPRSRRGGQGLRATARLIAAAESGATYLPVLAGDGPFDLRRLRSHGTWARVCVVGAMSAPHNGDRLRIEVVVGPGADLLVTSAAATVALPGPAPGHATLELVFSVADSARLHWLPEPLISATGSDLRQRVRVDLAPTARLLYGERQILCRAHEPTGRLTSRLTVRRAGRTLLDQESAYGPGTPGWDGPAILAGNRAVGQLLLVDPALGAAPTAFPGDADGHAVITPLPGPARLLTAVAPDARALSRHLDTGLHAIEPVT
jgi:urease accessory protein